MSVYLDASVLVSLFIEDSFSARAHNAFAGRAILPIVSDFAAAEFSSVIARLVRTRELSREEAGSVFSDFDIWVGRAATRMDTHPSDIRAAEVMLRRLDLTLRAPDALNIAIAQRLDAELATFDLKMAATAETLGLKVTVL